MTSGIGDERKKAIEKLVHDSKILDQGENDFLKRLGDHGFFDEDDWTMISSEFEPLMSQDLPEIKSVFDELNGRDKDVLSVITYYPGLTKELILIAFEEKKEDSVKKSIDRLKEMNLIFIIENDGVKEDKYYPTIKVR